MSNLEKPNNSLSILRRNLKNDIFEKRRSGNQFPICPVCSKPFSNNSMPDMHELFIDRGEVRGCSEETQFLIFVPQNVVLVHHEKCHILAQHYDEQKILCAKQIIQFEGYDTIVAWMDQFDSKVRFIDNKKRIILEEAWALLTKQKF